MSTATYVNRPETGTVPSRHILVHALHSISPAELPVLLVHVVRSRARVVSEPDTKILDLQWLLLVDLKAKGQQSHSACLLRAARDKLRIQTTLTPMISPLAFLTFFNCLQNVESCVGERKYGKAYLKKYQNRDLATTSLGAKMRMRKILGVGSDSVGRWRPTTWYSWRPISVETVSQEFDSNVICDYPSQSSQSTSKNVLQTATGGTDDTGA